LTVEAFLESTKPPSGTSAVCIVRADGSVETAGAEGFFEVGSITKTMTATLLAVLIGEGRLSLSTTVGEVLGADAGNVVDTTLLELATHTSGLPGLAPNAGAPPFKMADPYAAYDGEKLIEGLALVEIAAEKPFKYANLGFQLLGHVLGVAAGASFSSTLEERVLRPAGMATARCQPCSDEGLEGDARWHQILPGHGGVDVTIADLAAWARANLLPDSTPLADALRLAHEVHATVDGRRLGLAWVYGQQSIWHNGATGGYQSMMAVVPETIAVGGLASCGPGGDYKIDGLVGAYLGTQTG
jgi:CubicO group peptidase (beta-lactamase class C family)